MAHWTKILLGISSVLYLNTNHAQVYPFPQNVGYEYGYMSSGITSRDAQTEYELWLDKYYVSCSDTEARIDDNGITVSEGIGYGMVITAYAGDQARFDKLWNYYRNRRNGNGLMNWRYDGCGTGPSGSGSATDGDMDAAMGLIVAMFQWPGSGYEPHADALIKAMRKDEFDDCSGMTVQRPGDGWGGCSCTNPSYYSPAYYRVFARYYESRNDNESRDFWIKASSDAYTTLLANQHPASGLITAWCNKDGGEASGCSAAVSGGGSANTYQYDACRGTWRVANDYLWWGTPDAKAFLTKVVTFVKTSAGGITNIVDGYAHDGTPMGQWHNAPFVGSFALAGMATGQKDADSFLSHFSTVPGDNYFNTCLAVMYKFLATGNYWNPYAPKGPRCSRTDLGSALSLCGTAGVELSAGVEQQAMRTFAWYRDGVLQQSGASNTLAVTQAGHYSVLMDSAGACSSSAEVAISADIPAIGLADYITLKENTVLDAIAEGPGLSYQWFLNGSALPSATARSLVPQKSGTYKVVVAADGCTSKEDAIIAERPPYLSLTQSAIVVDGTPDACFSKWRNVAKAVKGTPAATDVSGRWSGAWDADKLYLFAEITDNTLTNDSDNWWEDDGLEIYVDGDDSRKSSYDKINDYQWGFGYGDTKVGSGGNNASGNADNIQFAIGSLQGGYSVEIAIPWSVIGIVPAAGGFIAMEVGINDDDSGGGTENKLLWFGATDMAWSSPSMFGQVALVNEDPEADIIQHLSLSEGWNLVSLFVDPLDKAPHEVFGSAICIKNMNAFYASSQPAFLNSLTSVEGGQAYFVMMPAGEDIQVIGSPLLPSPAPLRSGWQMAGCPWRQEQPLQTIFGTDLGSIQAIKDIESFWTPQHPAGLNAFEPGKGYMILK